MAYCSGSINNIKYHKQLITNCIKHIYLLTTEYCLGMSCRINLLKPLVKRRDVRLLAFGCFLVAMLSLLTNYSEIHIINAKSSYEDNDEANIFAKWKPHKPIQEYDVMKRRSKEMSSLNTYTHEDLSSLIFDNNTENLPSDVTCEQVMEGNDRYIQTAELADLEFNSRAFAEKKNKVVLSEAVFSEMTKNCEKFQDERKYFKHPLSAEEEDFPIAYVITIHKKVSMFERVLRSIYQVQNVYCVHVDAKSSPEFYKTIQRIVGCFPNVFLSSKRTDVHYSHWSRVEADLNCFKDLLKKKSQFDWKYVINLCGQDFPLKTNLEMVRALKLLQGRNNMESVSMPGHKKSRYVFHFELPDNGRQYAIMKRTSTRKAVPPIDTPMFAGSAYYIMTYDAVLYSMTNKKIQDFFQWNHDTFSPDEHLWATLQRMYPDFPGSEPPHPKYDSNELKSIARLVKWYGFKNPPYPVCTGRHVRGVCIYGSGDLPWLVEQPHLFANKFDDEKNAVTIECLDQWLRKKTVNQAIFYINNGYV